MVYDFFQESPENVQFGATPGYGDLLFQDVAKFDNIAEAQSGSSAEGVTRIITDDHTFPTPGVGDPQVGFIKATLYREGSQLEGQSQGGDAGFQTKEYMAKGFIVGDTAAVREKVENLANRGMIVLVKAPDCADNTLKQLGCKCEPAVLKEWKFTSGNKLTGGKKGYEVTFAATCLLDYQGTVTLND